VIGVRKEQIERYLKALMAYLNNVVVGQPLWGAKPWDKS
jgi:hypothetical protein